jgi:uncharacterized coiled-coil DUF342 family protein
LFPEPLNTIQQTITLEYIPESINKCKGSSSLLQTTRKYIGDKIHKIIDLIQEIWELAQGSTEFATRITNFKEYLQKYMENDEGFYKNVVSTFFSKVSILSNIHKREQNLPSNTQMKQINACWLKMIKKLREMISEIDALKNKRSDLFFKLVDLMKELDGPNLLMDTILS